MEGQDAVASPHRFSGTARGQPEPCRGSPAGEKSRHSDQSNRISAKRVSCLIYYRRRDLNGDVCESRIRKASVPGLEWSLIFFCISVNLVLQKPRKSAIITALSLAPAVQAARRIVCGRNSLVEWQLPKLHRGVRFPSPAPEKSTCESKCFFQSKPTLGGLVCHQPLAAVWNHTAGVYVITAQAVYAPPSA